MRVLVLVAAIGVLAACESNAPDGASPGGLAADPEAERLKLGETLSLACQACHSLRDDGRQLIGPNLYGVFGRPAGAVADFDDYSDALAAADFIWTPAVLDQWLDNPVSFLPGTTMAFTGYRSATDRAALIDYLIEATGAGDTGAPE